MASIDKRGNSFRIRVNLGYDKDGAKRTETMHWSPPQGMTERQARKAVEKIAFEFEEKVRTGRFLDGEKITFQDFVDNSWMGNYAKTHLKPSTVSWYQDMLSSRIIPQLGELKLSKIMPVHIIEFRTKLMEEANRLDVRYVAIDPENLCKLIESKKIKAKNLKIHPNTLRYAKLGRNVSCDTAQEIAHVLQIPIAGLFKKVVKKSKLSNQTVTHYLHCISSIMSTAVEWQVIESNPCDRVKSPSFKRGTIKYLEIDQAQELYDAALNLSDVRIQTAVICFLLTGLRKGELSGLQWEDIDFVKKNLEVNRTIQYVKGYGLITSSTKTEAGERVIAISDKLIEQFKKYKIWQDAYKQGIGDLWQLKDRVKQGQSYIPADRLFTTPFGDTIHPSTIYHWIKDFLAENGYPDMTVHGLRHTNISLMLSQGVDLITAAKRAGHSKPSTTADIYAHALKRPDEDAADKLDTLFNSPPKPSTLKDDDGHLLDTYVVSCTQNIVEYTYDVETAS